MPVAVHIYKKFALSSTTKNNAKLHIRSLLCCSTVKSNVMLFYTKSTLLPFCCTLCDIIRNIYIYGALFENTCTSARDKPFFTILNHVTKRQTPSLDKDSAKESKTCGLHNFWIL